MPAKQKRPKLIGENISGVQQCRNLSKPYEDRFNSLTEDVPLDVNVSCARSGHLGVDHTRACIVVFIDSGGRTLRHTEVPYDTETDDKNFACMRSFHTFCLCGRLHQC